ncbi:MAG: hypothetical protein Q8R98_21955 [Rubrivivax sp.]|nr:hypothetical protein [Rubrivivax sp.]MDP3614518.1 hypothetical protein [Rubrivivax sp.]
MRSTFTPYGLAALQRGFHESPDYTRRELLAAATEAVNLLESDVKGNYPRHTGLTSASITSDAFSTPAGVLGVVGSAAPVAVFTELGTRPHTPPLEPLLLWVRDVLGKTGDEGYAAARGIQRKIRARGTKANPKFAQAAQRHEGAIVRMFEGAAGRVAAHLAGPGGAA